MPTTPRYGALLFLEPKHPRQLLWQASVLGQCMSAPPLCKGWLYPVHMGSTIHTLLCIKLRNRTWPPLLHSSGAWAKGPLHQVQIMYAFDCLHLPTLGPFNEKHQSCSVSKEGTMCDLQVLPSAPVSIDTMTGKCPAFPKAWHCAIGCISNAAMQKISSGWVLAAVQSYLTDLLRAAFCR